MSHTRLIPVAIIGMLSLQPDIALAKSSAFALSSNVEGSEAKAVNASAAQSVLGHCITPCTLELKRKKIDYFVFTHPDYPNAYIPVDELDAALNRKGDVALHATFGKSFAEMDADREADFQAQYASDLKAALEGPDADAVPLVRTPPLYPPRADFSGWCVMGFDVTETGHASNIAALNCSDAVFESPSKRSFRSWRFIPKVETGTFVGSTNEQILISFKMQDETGVTLPPRTSAPKIKQ